jgi:hypothetical protein
MSRVLALALAAATQTTGPDPSMLEIRRLQAQVAVLQAEVQKGLERLDETNGRIKVLTESLGDLAAGGPGSLAGPFLAGPPASSDKVGVAKVAVFAPEVDIDSPIRHDIVFLKVRRIEAGAIRPVGETEIGGGETTVSLPLDRSGALYVVDWTTSEGYSYNLVLRDGASGQPAATVQVKPLQAEGRFLFVGYRVE